MDQSEAKPQVESTPFVYTPVIFLFKDDRNIRTNWPGVLPRVGEHVQLKGRDNKWIIKSSTWILDIDIAANKCERAVVIEVEKQ